MSLSDKIKQAIRNFNPATDDNQEWVKDLLQFLNEESANTRIHDPIEGGMFWCDGRDREFRRFATVDHDNADNEVALSRAIFNTEQIQVAEQETTLISFEAPLFRRYKGRQMRGRGDLVAIMTKPPRIIASEVKCGSGENLDMPYAILEAWIYGWVLNKHLRTNKEDFWNEMETTAKRYDISLGRATRGTTWGIGFSVAAPRFYFIEQQKYFSTTQDLISRLYNLMPEHNISFEGFWILDSNDNKGLQDIIHANNIVTPDETFIVPMLKSNKIKCLKELSEGSLQR